IVGAISNHAAPSTVLPAVTAESSAPHSSPLMNWVCCMRLSLENVASDRPLVVNAATGKPYVSDVIVFSLSVGVPPPLTAPVFVSAHSPSCVELVLGWS